MASSFSFPFARSFCVWLNLLLCDPQRVHLVCVCSLVVLLDRRSVCMCCGWMFVCGLHGWIGAPATCQHNSGIKTLLKHSRTRFLETRIVWQGMILRSLMVRKILISRRQKSRQYSDNKRLYMPWQTPQNYLPLWQKKIKRPWIWQHMEH